MEDVHQNLLSSARPEHRESLGARIRLAHLQREETSNTAYFSEVKKAGRPHAIARDRFHAVFETAQQASAAAARAIMQAGIEAGAADGPILDFVTKDRHRFIEAFLTSSFGHDDAHRDREVGSFIQWVVSDNHRFRDEIVLARRDHDPIHKVMPPWKIDVVDFKDASHRLRMSPDLLKWFCSYSPLRDGRKLQRLGADSFSVSELDAFNTHLHRPWPNKHVPKGIQCELRIEACGKCGVCEEPCETLEAAHIQRKDIELDFHCQHPANLILLCGTCHSRYDHPTLKQIDLRVVQTAKARLVSRKMEAGDRDAANARAVRESVEAAKAAWIATLSKPTADVTNLAAWLGAAEQLLAAAARSLAGTPGATAASLDPRAPAESLDVLSSWVDPTQQMTRALLHGYSLEASGEANEVPSDWDLVDEPPTGEHQCSICGGLLDFVEYDCQNCGHHGSTAEQPDGMAENAFGVLLPIYTDDRGDEHALECEQCDSQNLRLSYFESTCSACTHRFVDDDD